MDGKYITGICTVFVAVLMVGGLLMPIIDHTTEGEVKTNDGAGWIRMNYDTSAAATYEVTITPGEVGITVTNGTDSQSGADDTIFYADSNLAVWLEDGYFTVLGQSTNGPVFFQSEDDITITRDSGGVTVTDGVNTVAVGAPTWAYVPYSSGSYGFFADGTPVSIETPIAAAGGGFAGVYAYNDITRYAGLGLELQTTTEGGKITGAYWAKPSADEQLTPFEPGSITPIDPGLINGGDVDIQPIDPITIDPDPDAGLMGVPTPTYTDGDWGYDLATIDGVNKAKIVSYSGPGGDLTVPSTVGGYEVYKFGKSARNGNSDPVFNNSTIADNTTLILPDTVTQIGAYACYGITKLTSVILSNSLTEIGEAAFSSSGIYGAVIVPESCTWLGYGPFSSCANLDTVVLLGSPTSTMDRNLIYNSGVENIVCCRDYSTTNPPDIYSSTQLSEFLNLSDTDYQPGTFGIAAGVVVSDSIGDSIGYISYVKIGSGSDVPASASALMYVIPALILVSLVIFGAVVFVRRE